MKTVSKISTGLKGKIRIPGDKSVSHRALMLGAIASGTTKIKGLLESEDVLNTAKALRTLGAFVVKKEDGTYEVTGVSEFSSPDGALDMGNSGTGVRLLAGLLAGHSVTARFTGDASLCSRPMKRVTEPLSMMGARFETAGGGTLPMTEYGSAALKALTYELPVPSAQVKSAVLLAGLKANGVTSVVEPVPTRDHTERMLRAFGADISVESRNGGNVISVRGGSALKASEVIVPADVSSAAFPTVAALITKDSDILLENVGINPLRAGIIDVLKEMGADVSYESECDAAGEPVADIRVRSSELRGVVVPPEKAPSMIDEYPVLAVAAAFAEGETRLCGLSELKVKESDRFEAIIKGLTANGIVCFAEGDDLIIQGKGKNACGGGLIEAKLDHRIAMAFMVMGTACERPVVIDDVSSVATSFPDFIGLMNSKGARIDDYRD